MKHILLKHIPENALVFYLLLYYFNPPKKVISYTLNVVLHIN